MTMKTKDRWNIKATRELIIQNFGLSQLALTQPAIRSVLARQEHARYHFWEIKDLLDKEIRNEYDRRTFYDAVFLVDSEGRGRIDDCMVKVEAHMMACAQTIHAIGDTLAHLLYFSLGLGIHNPMPSKKVDLINITKKLETLAKDKIAYQQIFELLTEMQAAPILIKLSALVNHSKHRAIPEPIMAVDEEINEQLFSLQFGDFSYSEISYPREDMQNFLEPAFNQTSQYVDAIGKEINEVLRCLTAEVDTPNKKELH
jgi:hypothetical protein